MSKLKIPIPTIEDVVDANAYEARMHFLYPDGGKSTALAMVSKPTAEAAQAELWLDESDGFLLWVDFAEPEVVGVVESATGQRYRTVSHKAGEIAIRTHPDRLQPYDDVLAEEAKPNSFMRFWIGAYAMNTRRNFFGQKYHPLDDIYELHDRAEVKPAFSAFSAKAGRERWDPRINVEKAYIVTLARTAMQEFPDIFTNETAWPYVQLHALDEVLEKIASFE